MWIAGPVQPNGKTGAMQLSRLIAASEAQRVQGPAAVQIAGLTADSREVEPGFLFAALPGSKTDGARFVPAAIAKGAVAVLAGPDAQFDVPTEVAVVRAAEPRRALSLMAAALHGPQPATIVAVTGTNGKTSIAEFTRQIFAACGRKAASLGTIGVVKPDGAVYGSLTTPDPVTLHKTLAELAVEGVTHVALEASSHGLDQFRLDGVKLTAAAFNNLGRDHLDYHPTMEAYLAAKLRLFRALMQPAQTVVVNADGPAASEAAAAARARSLNVIETGNAGATIKLVRAERIGFGQKLRIAHAGVTYDIDLGLIGDYQAGNALVAAGLAIAAGEDPARAIRAIGSLKGVSGRLEVVAETKGATVVVDYAHKPEALEAAITALRPFAKRLVCAFGCGGDRDKGKRPIMGAIAARMCDAVIITDDNPRTEEPAIIRQEIMGGVAGTAPLGDVREIGDRAAAIRTGIAMLAAGDVLLVAGKGHETGQIVGNKTLPFSDQQEVLKAIREEGHGASPPVSGAASPLWSWDELIAASGGQADGMPPDPITGFSIDTRSIAPGEVFVALKDQRDGHEFVGAAFERGAAAALVSATYARKPGDGALLRIREADDGPLGALRRIGAAARARLAAHARVIAITGSAGKTGTTAMMRAALSSAGKTHAPEKSFNNHWGVPLTLARMPRDARFAVFEIGMNHANEIRPLVKLVRPHVAIIVNVLPVHVGNFADGMIGVAKAKGEILEGLEPGGVAVLPRDNPHFPLLDQAAKAQSAKVVTFGVSVDAKVRAQHMRNSPAGSDVTLPDGTRYRLNIPGEHIAINSLAVVAALRELGVSLDATLAIQSVTATAGRGGQRRCLLKAPDGRGLDDILLIDESYNANPASMRAALAVLGRTTYGPAGRRIAVMGDMRELGDLGPELHKSLIDAIAPNKVDRVFACGPLMKGLFDLLPAERRGAWGERSTDLVAPLMAALQPGDVVMIKGSLGTNMAPIVKELDRRDADLRGDGKR